MFGEKGCSILKIRDIKHPIVFITIFSKWRPIDYSRLYYCIFYDDNSFHVISFRVCTSTSNKVHFQLLMNLDFQSIIFVSTDQLSLKNLNQEKIFHRAGHSSGSTPTLHILFHLFQIKKENDLNKDRKKNCHFTFFTI